MAGLLGDVRRLPAPVQYVLNEIYDPLPSVVAGRWIALAIVSYTGVALRYGRILQDNGTINFPTDERRFVWYALGSFVLFCIFMMIRARRRITTQELRNVKLLALCVVQIALSVAVTAQTVAVDLGGYICVYGGCSAIARFLLLLRNPSS